VSYQNKVSFVVKLFASTNDDHVEGGGNNRGYLDISWLGLSTLQASFRKMHFVTGLGVPISERWASQVS
jgi:hypothetical protein